MSSLRRNSALEKVFRPFPRIGWPQQLLDSPENLVRQLANTSIVEPLGWAGQGLQSHSIEVHVQDSKHSLCLGCAHRDTWP